MAFEKHQFVNIGYRVHDFWKLKFGSWGLDFYYFQLDYFMQRFKKYNSHFLLLVFHIRKLLNESISLQLTCFILCLISGGVVQGRSGMFNCNSHKKVNHNMIL